MPVLKKIVVQDYRNIQLQELEFSPNINCICGDNGEGKTNLMDAIYYLSMTKSSQGLLDQYNFRVGSNSFAISGTYQMPQGQEMKIAVSVKDGGEKKVKKDEDFYSRLSEHIGLLPIVMVSPSDNSLVSDSGEYRRRFVNSVLSQIDREYLGNVQQYSKLLLSRNRILKEGGLDRTLLSVLDERMEKAARPVFERRRRFVEEMLPIVADYYASISGDREKIDMKYKSDLQNGSLVDIFRDRSDKDMLLKYTTAGIQRDEFLFEMNGAPIRRYGSQGQQKSFIVALKFAQYEIMKRNYGYPPILLLDDLFDKLDMNRVSNLLKMVAGSDFGQIFLSDCNKVRLHSIVEGITRDSAFFVARSGEFEYGE